MAWTDERLDGAFERIDRSFERVFAEMRDLRMEFRTELATQIGSVRADVGSVRAEVDSVRTDLGGRLEGLRQDLSAYQRQSVQISWVIVAVLVAQVVAILLTRS